MRDGANGVILPLYMRSAFSWPDMKLIWGSVDGVWRIGTPAHDGVPFGEDSEYGDDIPTAPHGMEVEWGQFLLDSAAESWFDHGELSRDDVDTSKSR